MTSDGLTYRFETAEQQRLCLIMAVAERHDLDRADGEPVASLAGTVPAFLMLPGGRLVWPGGDGVLRLGSEGCAGPQVGIAQRMTASRKALWALSGGGLYRLDPTTLQIAEIADAQGAIDIAADDTGLWLLLSGSLVHVGHARETRALPAGSSIDRIAAHGASLALLDRPADRLILQRSGQPDFAIDLPALLGPGEPAFTAWDIQSAADGVLLSGAWDGTPGFLLLDGNGEPGTWGVFENGAPTALAALDDALYGLFQDGGEATILRFAGATALGGQLWLTPALESDTLAGDWLQASVSATLPEGATLALRWAASRDPALRLSADALMRDDRLLLGERARILGNVLDWSPVTRTFPGTAQDIPIPEPFCFPLTGADGSFLWLALRLDRNNATSAPAIHGLVVSHDMPGLMQQLPAVYSSPAGDLDGTLGRLVALFQAVGGELDDAIDALASLFDPTAAPAPWLPRLAGLLDLPFDQTLPETAQRALIAAAPRLLAQRGTRVAVLTMLTATLGERPYRVIDRTGEFAAVTLGGSRLPAFLAGPSVANPRLNARLVLGRTALACPDAAPPETVSRAPELFVEIPASRAETRRYRTVIETMLASLVPAGVRLRVRWVARDAGMGNDTLTVLDDGRPFILGDARPLGIAPLGGDDSLIGSAGSSIPVTLQ